MPFLKEDFDHAHFDVKCIVTPVHKLLKSSLTQDVADGIKFPFWSLSFNFWGDDSKNVLT